jgi:drug/metabolite transporter (DMT)-like permease
VVGYWLGGEPVGIRTIIGGMFVLASVVAITSMRPGIKPVATEG